MVNGDGSFLKVSWKDCVQKDSRDTSCKTPDEITQFKEETHLVHFHNSQVYEPTKYSDDVVYNSSRHENFRF